MFKYKVFLLFIPLYILFSAGAFAQKPYKPFIYKFPKTSSSNDSSAVDANQKDIESARSLPVAPISDVVEEGPFGLVPKIASDGMTPFQAYASPHPQKDSFAKNAVIIHSLGLQQGLTQKIIDALPPEVTLAFTPYAPDLDEWVKKAREKGHEVLLQLPIESKDAVFDPGPEGLRTGLSPEDNLQKLLWLLSRMTGYIGVVTIMPSEINDNSSGPFVNVLKDLDQRGLLLVTPLDASQTSDSSLRYYLAITNNQAPDSTPAELDLLLQKLGSVSSSSSFSPRIIAIPPSPASVDALIGWFKKQSEPSSHYISPLSYLVRDNDDKE